MENQEDPVEDSQVKLRRALETQEFMFRCKICKEVYGDLQDFLHHKRSHTQEELQRAHFKIVPTVPASSDKPDPVPVASTSSRPVEPQSDKKQDPADEPVSVGLSCPLNECSVKKRTQRDIVHHVLMFHSDHRPFACSECNFVSVQLGILRQHEIAHRTPDVFKCGFCSASFRNLSTRSKHILGVHPGSSTEISLNPVQPRKSAVATHDSGVYKEADDAP